MLAVVQYLRMPMPESASARMAPTDAGIPRTPSASRETSQYAQPAGTATSRSGTIGVTISGLHQKSQFPSGIEHTSQAVASNVDANDTSMRSSMTRTICTTEKAASAETM